MSHFSNTHRQLKNTWIVITDAHAVTDPLAFLRTELGSRSDAIVVMEETDRVATVALDKVTVSERTLHLHGFSKTAAAQARAARAGTGWVADSVRECDQSTAGARKVLAQDGRMMCLGERIPGTSGFAEARIQQYEIQVPLPAMSEATQLDVAYRNYHEETASGRHACIAHRAVEFVAREGK